MNKFEVGDKVKWNADVNPDEEVHTVTAYVSMIGAHGIVVTGVKGTHHDGFFRLISETELMMLELKDE